MDSAVVCDFVVVSCCSVAVAAAVAVVKRFGVWTVLNAIFSVKQVRFDACVTVWRHVPMTICCISSARGKRVLPMTI